MRIVLVLLLLAGCNAAPGTPSPAPSDDRPVAEADRPPDLGALPDLVHRAANDARRTNGASTLGWSDDLARLAAAHSRDMATRGYFDHVSPEGTTPNDRALADDIQCRLELGGGRARLGVAENLYMTSAFRQIRTSTRNGVETRTVDWFTPDDLAEETIQGWLDSPGHRTNLLDGDAQAQGIGVAVADETVYVTQVLC